ncbi:hypothetical protein ACWEHA_33810 [Amycolatopsis nivea]
MDWRMRPSTRKWFLFGHVVTSVGWIGAELAVLICSILAIAGLDPVTTRSANVIAGILAGALYLPASLLALATGVVLGLGTKWKLVRYHWVLWKLVATLALFVGGNLLVVPSFVEHGEQASRGEIVGASAVSGTGAMSVGLTLLLGATLVSYFKPWPKVFRAN